MNPRVLAGGLMTVLIFTFTPASAASSSTTYEAQVVKWTNVKRVERDKVALKEHSCVDRYAEQQAAWLASHRVLKHQNLKTILKACHFRGVSENIAYGYTSGSGVVTAWMKSPGHRANLLDSKMRYIGVGAVRDSKGRWWVSQVFGRK